MDEDLQTLASKKSEDIARLYENQIKLLISHKPILSHILKDVMREFERTEPPDIERCIDIDPLRLEHTLVNPHEGELVLGRPTEISLPQEGRTTFDLRFDVAIPDPAREVPRSVGVNIEIQDDFSPGYPLVKRAMFYCARMLAAQRGREFRNDDYEKLHKSYSIWICTSPNKAFENTITRYYMTNEMLLGKAAWPKDAYDLVELVFVCLSKDPLAAPPGLCRFLSSLLSPRLSRQEKMLVLAERGIELTADIAERVNNVSHMLTEYGNELLAEYRNEIWDKAVAQGREEGLREGAANYQTALMRESGLSSDELFDRLGIPPERRPANPTL